MKPIKRADPYYHAANCLVSAAGAVASVSVGSATGAAASVSSFVGSVLGILGFEAKKPFVDEVAQKLKTRIKHTHLSEEHRTLIPEMFLHISLTEKDINEAGRDVDEIARRMLLQVPNKTPFNEPILHQRFRDISAQILTELMADQAFENAVAYSLTAIARNQEDEASRADERHQQMLDKFAQQQEMIDNLSQSIMIQNEQRLLSDLGADSDDTDVRLTDLTRAANEAPNVAELADSVRVALAEGNSNLALDLIEIGLRSQSERRHELDQRAMHEGDAEASIFGLKASLLWRQKRHSDAIAEYGAAISAARTNEKIQELTNLRAKRVNLLAHMQKDLKNAQRIAFSQYLPRFFPDTVTFSTLI
uniref:hypothetical protein n=1 Tax=Planktotalea sp. TaxID=2029877 RepID=UPI003D6B712F